MRSLLRLLGLALVVLVTLTTLYAIRPIDPPHEPVECVFVPAPINKRMIVEEPDKIICPVTRFRN